MSGHLDPAVLEQADLPAAVQAHLVTCARCRIDRRMLLDLESDDGVTPSVASVLPDPVSLVATWRSANATSLFQLSDDFGDDDALPPADQLGPYAIDALLGRGGMAVVYRVVDRRTGAHRALKVLRRSDPEQQRRLAREGRVQAALQSPNVVRVVDVLEVDGGPALVLEYVPGPSLQQVLRDTPLDLDVADRVAAEVLGGMAAAHAAGVIHRDLKPGNVLLEPSDDGFVARVTDFGLARASEGGDSLHTRTGAFAGTPLYMAPEQLRDASKADARSDVFSLGALLYELVTGIRCFAGLDYVDIVRRVADVRWTPVDEMRLGVPARMTAAIATALQVEPADRPPDAGALLALWAPETPDAPWPADRVVAGIGLHAPEPIDNPAQALPEHNLPAAADTFVGRGEVGERMATRLVEERLVTLTGPGGVGKTRLATEVARGAAYAFPGGVWFCDLTPARSVDGIAAAVAQALQIDLQGDPVRHLGGALAARGRTLLVLDNFEQVVEHADATLEPWLQQAPDATFLVTSREPLDLFDEVTERLDILDEGEAVELFVARARRAVPGFSLSDDNRDVVHRIVARLDALPLAIEIVAARVRSEDLARVSRHLDRFSGDRHATLRETLDGSWDLLSPDERTALTRLTVFETPCSVEAAEAVLGPVAWAVDDLVRRSLVHQAGDRLRLLVPVRQWASGKLGDEARVEAEIAHGRYFADIGEGGDDRLDDLVAATRRALKRDDVEVANGAAIAAHGVMVRRGPVRRAIALAQSLLDHPHCTGAMRGRWLNRLARLCVAFAESQVALRHLQEARQLAIEAGDEELQGDVLNWIGIVMTSLDRVDEARSVCLEALALSERNENRQRMAFLFGQLGAIELKAEDLDASRAHFEHSLTLHRQLGNERGVALVLGDLGIVDLEQDRAELAERRIREAIEILARQNNPIEEAVGWDELCRVLRATGRVAEARQAAERCLSLYRNAGARDGEVSTLLALASLDQEDLADLDSAGDWLEEALRLAREVGEPPLVAAVLQRLSALRAAQGSAQLAERLAEQAREILPDS